MRNPPGLAPRLTLFAPTVAERDRRSPKRRAAPGIPAALVLLFAGLIIPPTGARNAQAAEPIKAAPQSGAPGAKELFFMPDAAASKIVTVTRKGTAATAVVLLTEAVAVKENGPKATIAHFGEVYAFSPTFVAVHRGEPTRITLWNLQPDDEHDFTLAGAGGRALMRVRMAPLSQTSYIFTFHHEGLFDFRCAIHQPEMNGQILVLPARQK